MSVFGRNANGQATGANSAPIVIASDQTYPDLGAKADASATTDTGTFSLIALIKRLVAKRAGLGTGAMAASNAVTIATDDTVMVGAGATQQSRITDGTQQANTFASDSGENGLIVGGSRKEQTTALSSSNTTALDCSNYAWVSVHVTAYTSGTVTFQGSNDNSTWTSVVLSNAASATGTQAATATAAGLFHGPCSFRYFRVTGGVATVVIELFSTARTTMTIAGAVTLAATQAIQGAKTNNNAVPGATNIGALTGLANAAAPTDTEGDLVLLSTDLAGNLRVAPTPYPAAATALTATSGDVANTAAVATLAGTASKTTYITGFSLFPGGATAMGVVVATVTGLISGTLSVLVAATAIATAVNGSPIIVNFPYPIPASAANTAIVVTMPALGTGNLHAVANAQGFQL